MDHSAVLRLVVFALREVLEDVAGAAAIDALFEQTEIHVSNELLYIDVVLVVF